MRTRAGISGAWLVPLAPVAFEYWRPDFGPGFTMIHPVSEMMDAAVEMDSYELRFDGRKFQKDFGAIPTYPVSRATVGPVLALLRFHRSDEGFRPYGDAGIGILDVSRPMVSYRDTSGAPAQLQGAEIFGLDLCYSAGGGMEWVDFENPMSGYLGARLIVAPAHSYPTHAVFTVRGGLLVRLWF